jgi:hypothetical protein
MSEVDFDNLRDRYASFFAEEPAPDGAIEAIESALDIVLPDDLKEIGKFYSGGMLGGISHVGIEPSGIVAETLRLREAVNLPRRLLFLAEPSESLIVLDCEASTSDAPSVIWCDAGCHCWLAQQFSRRPNASRHIL